MPRPGAGRTPGENPAPESWQPGPAQAHPQPPPTLTSLRAPSSAATLGADNPFASRFENNPFASHPDLLPMTGGQAPHLAARTETTDEAFAGNLETRAAAERSELLPDLDLPDPLREADEQGERSGEASGVPLAEPAETRAGVEENDWGSNTEAHLGMPSKTFQRFLKLFPALYTYVVVMLMSGPIAIIYFLSMDPDVEYWITPHAKFVALLPLLFIVGHVMHARAKVPKKGVVLITIIIPCIILLGLGDIIMTRSSDLSDELFALDCSTFGRKFELQRAWNAADRLYRKCIEDTASKSGMTAEELLRRFRVTDCEEYLDGDREREPALSGEKVLQLSPQKQWRAHWDYLGQLETSHFCSGWCGPNRQLWAFEDSVDSCSVAVSQVFDRKVRRLSKLVTFYVLGLLVVTSVLLIAIGPHLRAQGVDW